MGNPGSIWLTSSNCAICLAVSDHLRHFRFSANCSGVRAPRMGIVLRARSQFSATCAGDFPAARATLTTAVAIAAFRSVRRANCGVWSSRRPASAFSAYLPVSQPLANGDHGVTVNPSAAAIGSSSRSGVRSIRLYSICKPTNGVQPRNSASVLARATHHAGASEMPMYSTLPARTKSSKARMTSSTGVNSSQACIQ